MNIPSCIVLLEYRNYILRVWPWSFSFSRVSFRLLNLHLKKYLHVPALLYEFIILSVSRLVYFLHLPTTTTVDKKIIDNYRLLNLHYQIIIYRAAKNVLSSSSIVHLLSAESIIFLKTPIDWILFKIITLYCDGN